MRQNELQRLSQLMESIFQQHIAEPGHSCQTNCGNEFVAPTKKNYRTPIADVIRNQENTIITLEMPGVEKNDIEVKSNDAGLEVKAKGFYRFFRLGKDVSSDNIKATYKNGILELQIPKKQSKEIKVE